MKNILALVVIICILYYQTTAQISFEGIYIQQFRLNPNERNEFTKDITDQYRIVLNKQLDRKVVNRETIQQLDRIKENELVILEGTNGNTEISRSLEKKLQEIGVSMTVEGWIKYIPHKSLYVIRVKFSNIFTKEETYENEITVKASKIDNRDYLKEQFIKIIPAADQQQKQVLIDDIILNSQENPWILFNNLYFEDFSDRTHPEFLAHIWNLRNQRDYWSGVKYDKYCFEIKRNDYSRHKYIESAKLNYNTQVQTMPYSLVVELSNNLSEEINPSHSARGLTVRYNKDKRTCYAYTLTNEGDLRFVRVYDIFNPENNVTLHSQRIEIKPKGRYKLGIVCVADNFYLYLDDQLIKRVQDDSFPIGFHGVFANGKGSHFIDNVTVCEAFYYAK